MEKFRSSIALAVYRLPMPVHKVISVGGSTYPVCPHCGCTLDREYMHFCDRCGQKLSWVLFGF